MVTWRNTPFTAIEGHATLTKTWVSCFFAGPKRPLGLLPRQGKLLR